MLPAEEAELEAVLPAEDVEPVLLPQAARPRTIAKAMVKARNFFMVNSPFQ